MPKRQLKVDLHMHAGGDPYDKLDYSPQELIEAAADHGFDAIAITNHDCDIYCPRLAGYGRDKGVILIPGIEFEYRRQHIVLLNFRGVSEIQTTDDIIARKSAENLVIAAHPYYPFAQSSGPLLESMPELFDAVEHSQLYIKGVNCNQHAISRANELGLPLVGTSDAHSIESIGYTYTLVRSEKTPEAIIAAIKSGDSELVTRPLPFSKFSSFIASAAWGSLRRRVRRALFTE